MWCAFVFIIVIAGAVPITLIRAQFSSHLAAGYCRWLVGEVSRSWACWIHHVMYSRCIIAHSGLITNEYSLTVVMRIIHLDQPFCRCLIIASVIHGMGMRLNKQSFVNHLTNIRWVGLHSAWNCIIVRDVLCTMHARDCVAVDVHIVFPHDLLLLTVYSFVIENMIKQANKTK